MASDNGKLPPFELIDTAAAWRGCVAVLERAGRLAIDLEADSLYSYREQVCLLQITVPGHDYIVDPLAGFALDGLQDLLSDPAREKIFHASEYDLILLKRQYGWQVNHLFDTMWAARMLGYKNMGLAWFLREFYGITISKKHQKANWGKRPLSDAELAYAQTDTHYLPDLRDEFAARLADAGIMEEAREIFINESRVRVPERAFDPDGFWNLRGARDLTPRHRAVLRAVYLLREEIAQKRNIPPFKVLGNETLLALAHHAPKTLPELLRIHGVSPKFVERAGARMLDAIQDALDGPVPQPPARRPRLEEGVIERFDKLQDWRKRQAQQRGVESDVIMTRETMWEIARLNPGTIEDLAQIRSLGPHRRALYDKNILQEIQ